LAQYIVVSYYNQTTTSKIDTLSLHDALPILKLRYAAELYGLKYALKEVRKIDEEKFLCYFENLNPGIIENIKETEEFWSKHKNLDRKSTRLNSSHVKISYDVFCLKKKTIKLI